MLAGAKLYLNIYAVGLPASFIYNYGAAILRAVGDTKRPLYYLTISGVVNIILNVLLVAGLKLSVAASPSRPSSASSSARRLSSPA